MIRVLVSKETMEKKREEEKRRENATS